MQTASDPRRRTGAAAAILAFSFGACGGPNPDHSVQLLDPASDSFAARLEPLARAIGDRRIVRLGENGHGVAEHTELKVRLVDWLHRELGTTVDSIRAWADSMRPYLRIGLEELEMVPTREFDALFYVDRVTPPEYRIP